MHTAPQFALAHGSSNDFSSSCSSNRYTPLRMRTCFVPVADHRHTPFASAGNADADAGAGAGAIASSRDTDDLAPNGRFSLAEEEPVHHRRSPPPPQQGQQVRRFSLERLHSIQSMQESRELSPFEVERMGLLTEFKLADETPTGFLTVMAMKTEQLKDLINLLADAYAELMWGIFTYRPVLSWILGGYLKDRQASLPHAVTLVALYEASDEDGAIGCDLVGAVEISFNADGQPKDMITPLPPKDAPFLSNMAVMKNFRRKGIGSQLLKASELLAVQMGCKEMYLHCRLIDEVPLNMYIKAGYEVVATDSVLTLLTFQRRRHLMRKCLSVKGEYLGMDR